MGPPDDFFFEQEQELMALEDKRVLRFIRYLEQSRKSLHAELKGYEGGKDAQRLQSLITQIDAIEQDLLTNFREISDPTEPLARLVARHQSESFSVILGKPLTISADVIPTTLLAQVVESNFEKVTSLTKSQLESLRGTIFTRIGIQGHNPRQVAFELTGPEGQFSQPFPLIENILRTESSTLYNTMRLDSLLDANHRLDLGLNKRIVERMDVKRNHPISRVINNQVKLAHEPFKVRVADVRAELGKLNPPRKLSQKSLDRSIFWQKQGEFYIGQNLPAHYRERGIVVPTQRDVTNA